MARLALIHSNPDAVRRRVALLRRAGHRVTVPSEQSSAGLRVLRDVPPDAFVIDLDRRPSHGRDVALWLRQSRGTRRTPLVFAGGAPDKVERIREALPDAVYTDWSRARGAVRRALSNPPDDPVVPRPAGFGTGTALARKLGVKAGARVALLGAPAGFERLLEPLPADVRFTRRARGAAHLVLLFVKSRAALDRRLPAAKRTVAAGGSLWIAWPKQASVAAGDLDQAAVRAKGLRSGLVDYKIAAIDATWSGLRFAVSPRAGGSPSSRGGPRP